MPSPEYTDAASTNLSKAVKQAVELFLLLKKKPKRNSSSVGVLNLPEKITISPLC